MRKFRTFAAMAILAGLLSATATGCASNSESADSTQNSTTTTSAEATDSSSESESSAEAADYPSKTITMIVPASAGGDTDLKARLAARYLEKELGQSVVISNVSGGATSVASMQLMESDADGYTVLFNHNSLLTNKIFGTTDFDHRKMKVAGSLFKSSSGGLVTHKDDKVQTFQELLDQLKAEPASLDFATETGGSTYLEVLAIQKAFDVQFNVVDAGDGAQRTSAMMGGHIDVMASDLNNVKDYIDSGDFIPLVCVNSGEDLQDKSIPTMESLGYDFEWPDFLYSVFMPGDTPQAIVDKFSEAMATISADPEYKEEAETMKSTVSYMNSEDATAFYNNAADIYASYADQLTQ